jgi:SWI/SNF-related matrix-associated actin-dependent regulator 1 of chromatin subfamily A
VLYRIIHKKRSIANQIMASEDDIPTDEMYFDELVNNFLNDDGI